MTAARSARFTVTFAADLPLDLIDGMLQSDFMGLGKTYRRDDPRVLFLRAFPEAYVVAKATLQELRDGGALTFVEETR